MAVGPDRRMLPVDADVRAPDGSEVRILAANAHGSMAEFRLLPGQASIAVVHRTVAELWFVTEGAGQIWLGASKTGDDGGDESEEILDLEPGQSVSIATGTPFQFRANGAGPLRIVGVTMPPWPGDDEAQPVHGRWDPNLLP